MLRPLADSRIFLTCVRRPGSRKTGHVLMTRGAQDITSLFIQSVGGGIAASSHKNNVQSLVRLPMWRSIERLR